MTLYESLIDKYGFNEPFLSSDISFNSYSRAWIFKEIRQLCKSGKIVRYEKGVYFIPKQTRLGTSVVDPLAVVERKYIKSNDQIFGYYGGQTFLNRLGLTTQVPNLIEIYTNKEASKVRNVSVGSINVRLRKTKVGVTEKNAAVLSFLELMNYLPTGYLNEEKKKVLEDYVVKNNITRNDISLFAPKFSDKAMRNLVESEVIYSVAR